MCCECEETETQYYVIRITTPEGASYYYGNSLEDYNPLFLDGADLLEAHQIFNFLALKSTRLSDNEIKVKRVVLNEVDRYSSYQNHVDIFYKDRDEDE